MCPPSVIFRTLIALVVGCIFAGSAFASVSAVGAAFTTQSPNGHGAALNTANGESLVAYHERYGKNQRIWAQRLNVAGRPTGERTLVSSHWGVSDDRFRYEADVAYNSLTNQFLVTWSGGREIGTGPESKYEIYAQRLSARGEKVGPRLQVSRTGPVSDTRFAANRPRVAYSRGENVFRIVWNRSDSRPTSRTRVASQLVSPSGVLVGQNSTLTGTDAEDFHPSIVADDRAGGFRIAWTSWPSDPPAGQDTASIRTARVSASFPARVDQMNRLSRPPTDSLADDWAELAHDPARHRTFIVWTRQSATSDNVELRGRLVASSGALAGAEFRVSRPADFDLIFHGLAHDVSFDSTSGRFLVAFVLGLTRHDTAVLDVDPSRGEAGIGDRSLIVSEVRSIGRTERPVLVDTPRRGGSLALWTTRDRGTISQGRHVRVEADPTPIPTIDPDAVPCAVGIPGIPRPGCPLVPINPMFPGFFR